MAEATSGKALNTTRYPRLLRIVDKLEECGKIIASKADHYRHLFQLIPTFDAITSTLEYGQTRSRETQTSRAQTLKYIDQKG